MEKIIPEKVAGSGYSLLDFFAIGISKRTTEVLLTPVVGNGTLKSGVIKTLGGVVLGSMMKPKDGFIGHIPSYVAAGLVIDGVEDITMVLLGPNPLEGIMGGITGQAQNTNAGLNFI